MKKPITIAPIYRWNRLGVMNSSKHVVASYVYDALGRRITETDGAVSTDLY